MSHLLYRIGHFAGRHPWRVIAAWIFVAGAILTLNASQGGEFDESFSLPGSESQRAADAIEERFPQETPYSSHVVFHSDDGLTDPDSKAAIRQAVDRLAEGQHVVAVSSPYDPRGPTVSGDGQTAFATVAFDIQKVGAEELDEAEKSVQQVRDAGIQVEYDGGLGYADVETGGNGEMIGILMAIVILAVAFGSLVAMSLPIVTALVAIVVGSSAIGIMSGIVPVPEVTGVVAMMLGLGVGIDYALFILTRHRQNLASGQSVPVAIGRANATAGLSVLFAGVTVMVAILGLKVSGIPMMEKMGYGSAIMVAVVMLASITLLPAILGLVKHRVNSARIPFVKPRPAYDPDAASARWAARVVARPVLYGGVAAAVSGGARDPGVLDVPGLRGRWQRRTVVDHSQGLRPGGRRLRAGGERTARGGPRHRRLADPRRHHRRGLDRAREPGGRGVGQRARRRTRRRTSRSSASSPPRPRRTNAPVSCSSASVRTPFPPRWADPRSPRPSPARPP